MSEQDARIVINRKLAESGWKLEGSGKNVKTEESCATGACDYLLLGRNGQNLAVVEAKADDYGDVYSAKDQARGYAQAMGCRYVFLANTEQIYFWDLDEGDARPIERFISPEDLQRRSDLKRVKKPLSQIEHPKVIADRPYQIEASEKIAGLYDSGKRAFLLEMATGTGKTRLAASIVDRFLRSHQAERVLFIVDRIELAKQALESFQLAFRDRYKAARYKPGRHGEWGGASVVIATIQSLNIHYREDFTPGYFDLVFNDECHRSIYGELPRQVVEYFQATRIGLTATPKDFLKNIDITELADDNPKALEYRMMRDTYKHFGCEPGEPTFRYSIQDAVNAPPPGPWLVPQKIYKLYSLITNESVSKEGWSVEIDGEDYTFKISQLERKVNVPARNRLICEEFLKYAMNTPDGSIGKTIVFAVSQDHAAALAKTLNELSPQSNGKFAQVITSRVKDASASAKKFRKSENYWPRVAVTVDMLSTGYDCPELLNIVLARPIASPTTYIQIKGRGTRLYTFPDGTPKKHFIIHDFCEVVKYFDEDYDYEAPLPIPRQPGPLPPEPPLCPVCGNTPCTCKDEICKICSQRPCVCPPLPPEPICPICRKSPCICKSKLVAETPDVMYMTEFIEVGPEGEKVDRMMYQTKWEERIREVAQEKPELSEAAKTGNFTDELLEYLYAEILNKPKEYFNETNLAKVYRIFADITDFIKEALGTAKLPTQKEQFSAMLEFLRVEYNLNVTQMHMLKMLAEQITQSPTYAEQFDKGDFTFLNNPPFGSAGVYIDAFGEDKIKPIFLYIKQSHSFKFARMK